MNEAELDRMNALNWVSFYMPLVRALKRKRSVTEVHEILTEMRLSRSGILKALKRGYDYGVITRGSSYYKRHVPYVLTEYGIELMEEIEDGLA